MYNIHTYSVYVLYSKHLKGMQALLCFVAESSEELYRWSW